MARFKTEDDPGFISVVGELQRWMTEIRSPHSKARRGPSDMVESTVSTRATPTKESYGGITIWGDVVKSNISRDQTIHGNLIFGD
jgi:hypothetical protein